jgi:hypothetical protein
MYLFCICIRQPPAALSLTWFYKVYLHIECVLQEKNEGEMQWRVRYAFIFTLLTTKNNFTRRSIRAYLYGLKYRWQQITFHLKIILLYIPILLFFYCSLFTSKWEKNIVLPLIPKLYKTSRQPAHKSWSKSGKNRENMHVHVLKRKHQRNAHLSLTLLDWPRGVSALTRSYKFYTYTDWQKITPPEWEEHVEVSQKLSSECIHTISDTT